MQAVPFLFDIVVRSQFWLIAKRQTWNMDPNYLEDALKTLIKEGRKPKAVIVVQIYGQCAQMDRLLGICNEYEVPVIEDAAESLGAS